MGHRSRHQLLRLVNSTCIRSLASWSSTSGAKRTRCACAITRKRQGSNNSKIDGERRTFRAQVFKAQYN